jgi:NADH pyrophosphatase NudC (nudix superfamily)
MQNLNEELFRLKQMMGINPNNDLINEEKADRCLRIARRKYDKPSAYRSGAIVRCRQGKIWKDLKEEDINEAPDDIKDLLYKAHDGITRTKGKEYAPDSNELQAWIDDHLDNEESINESFKITFEDEKNIENEIRKKYDKYLDEIKKDNDYIKAMKLVLNMADNDEQREFFNKGYGRFKDMDFTIPIRYNKFYAENKKEITDDYIRYKSNNSPTTFEYPTKPIKIDIDKYYSSLSKNELESIKKFLYIVAERVNSGTGESVNRKHVRDAFFRTPKTFQETFSEKPNGYLWRGDYTHPKDPDYDHNDKEYLSMQSFSTSKNTARSFGYNFSASNIKSYSGSFSLEKFLHYGITDIFAGIAKFGDDEGEVMFFDVTYKNKSMDEAKKTDYSKEKKSGLHGWFSRRGGDGNKGWVDCNTCRTDPESGRKKCKACGREKGEKRSKYPSCRPTPASCGTPGKGKKWGKTKNESINESEESLKRVALLFIVLDNKALLFKRSKYETTNPNKYGMLGGGIEEGETPEEALKREIQEEAGVELLSFKPLNVYKFNESVELNVFYTNEFDMDNIDLDENEHTSYRFFTMEQIMNADPEQMISTNKQIANDYNEIINEKSMLQEQLNNIKRFL